MWARDGVPPSRLLTATSSASVFQSTETVNMRLLRAASVDMKVWEEDYSQKLKQKMMLPFLKPAKGLALILAYSYAQRVVGYPNASPISVAVASFVKHPHGLNGMGVCSSPSPSATRRVLKLSADECAELLRDDAFSKDAHGRLAMLESLTKMIDEIEGTASVVAWTGPNKAIRVIRCLYGHFANASFRILLIPQFCPHRPRLGLLC